MTKIENVQNLTANWTGNKENQSSTKTNTVVITVLYDQQQQTIHIANGVSHQFIIKNMTTVIFNELLSLLIYKELKPHTQPLSPNNVPLHSIFFSCFFMFYELHDF